MDAIQVGRKKIGLGQPIFVIGEVAQAHEGSLNLAHAFIDAIADAGADAVKFQTHIAEAESTTEEELRKGRRGADESWAEYWRRTAFSEAQWEELAQHANEKDLIFLSSPFSVEAAQLLERVGVAAWKVASGEVTNYQMLEFMAGTGKTLLLSAGMSDWAEQDRVVKFIQKSEAPLALFQCTTSYPTPPEELGLNLIAQLRERYKVPVGLSDHSGAIYAGLAAASLGTDMLEVHVTLSRAMPNAILDACLTTQELKQLVEGVRHIERMLNSPVDKDQMAAGKADLRRVFFRSVVPRASLAAGTVLTENHLTTKKPGTGIPAERLNELIGRKLAKDVEKDHLLAEEDLA